MFKLMPNTYVLYTTMAVHYTSSQWSQVFFVHITNELDSYMHTAQSVRNRTENSVRNLKINCDMSPKPDRPEKNIDIVITSPLEAEFFCFGFGWDRV